MHSEFHGRSIWCTCMYVKAWLPYQWIFIWKWANTLVNRLVLITGPVISRHKVRECMSTTSFSVITVWLLRAFWAAQVYDKSRGVLLALSQCRIRVFTSRGGQAFQQRRGPWAWFLLTWERYILMGVVLSNNIYKQYNLSLWVNAFVAKHKCVYGVRKEDD